MIHELNETISDLGNRYDIETLELQRQLNTWRERFLKASKKMRLISHDNKIDSVEAQHKLNAIRRALLSKLEESRNKHRELMGSTIPREDHDRRITELNEHHTLNMDKLVNRFKKEIAELQDKNS